MNIQTSESEDPRVRLRALGNINHDGNTQIEGKSWGVFLPPGMYVCVFGWDC